MNDSDKIKSALMKISALEAASPYGTEYQLWDKALEGPIRNLFGEAGLKLFKQQESVVIPADNDKWKQQYIGDLSKKKRALEGMLSDPDAFKRLQPARRKPSEPFKGYWSRNWESIANHVIKYVLVTLMAFFFYIVLHYIGINVPWIG